MGGEDRAGGHGVASELGADHDLARPADRAAGVALAELAAADPDVARLLLGEDVEGMGGPGVQSLGLGVIEPGLEEADAPSE